MWQREDHVDVIDRQQLVDAGIQPTLLGQGLAFRAVPIATGAPHHALGAASRADLARAPECRGAAALDSPQGGELHSGQTTAGAEMIAVVPDEVGQFKPLSPPPAVRAGRIAGQDLLRGVEQIER